VSGVPVTDSFSLLSEPRRPWLEAEALKARIVPLLAATHPDRVHGGSEAEKLAANTRHAELNAAYNTLREPRDRLLHLYELEAGEKPRDIQRIPPGTMDLFVDVGQTCRDVDEFLQRKAVATSPMLRLSLMQEGLDHLDRLQALQTRVTARRQELESALKSLNTVWETAPPEGTAGRRETLPLETLEQTYRSMSYVARWTGQLQERLVTLAT
jgi:DnaJ-domain-containing protein 1